MKRGFPLLVCAVGCALATLVASQTAHAVTSAELYTGESYVYGRFEARIRFAPGSGVVSSFFLWKDGSEIAGTYWNELDFEKVNDVCRLETNVFYGDPVVLDPRPASVSGDLCGEYHTYAYEWTPEYIAWFVDDMEIRRETGEVATAFSDNASSGMQIRFNIWPGDASFGGVFDQSVLPVYQYIDWIQYSSYADGSFEVEWREDFDEGSIPAGWLRGSWGSPKGLSTHSAQNVGVVDGYAVLALTGDDAAGIEGAAPEAPPEPPDPDQGGTGASGDSGGSCRLVSSGAHGGASASLLLGAFVLGRSRRRRRAASSGFRS